MILDFSLAHILQEALRDMKEPFRENIGMALHAISVLDKV